MSSTSSIQIKSNKIFIHDRMTRGPLKLSEVHKVHKMSKNRKYKQPFLRLLTFASSQYKPCLSKNSPAFPLLGLFDRRQDQWHIYLLTLIRYCVWLCPASSHYLVDNNIILYVLTAIFWRNLLSMTGTLNFSWIYRSNTACFQYKHLDDQLCIVTLLIRPNSVTHLHETYKILLNH